MKTIKLLLFSLLITTISYSQTDTLYIGISGNKYFKFINSKFIENTKTKYIEKKIIYLKKNQYLKLQLSDSYYKNNNYYNNKRNITIFYRNGTIKNFTYISKHNIHEFNGNKIKKIIISKPGKPKISKSIKC